MFHCKFAIKYVYASVVVHAACEEDVDHLFTSCGLSDVCLGKLRLVKAVHAVFMATMWAIWRHRNAAIFKGDQPSPLTFEATGVLFFRRFYFIL
ncbi:hypothetical protein QVD17_36552 [Tagetes erecta]|uniref:Uncharacterized protein n=1 Tax=Tagetes erecta TaxID=13708 RepID=A0AAD8JYS9_TARER|nr:hypothetical protein QVD17_36552 [Tagetes erecta]